MTDDSELGLQKLEESRKQQYNAGKLAVEEINLHYYLKIDQLLLQTVGICQSQTIRIIQDKDLLWRWSHMVILGTKPKAHLTWSFSRMKQDQQRLFTYSILQEIYHMQRSHSHFDYLNDVYWIAGLESSSETIISINDV